MLLSPGMGAVPRSGPRGVGMGLKGVGGAEGDRTPDLRNAIATLSQLSYGPETFSPFEVALEGRLVMTRM
jgi:hypothetical protein